MTKAAVLHAADWGFESLLAYHSKIEIKIKMTEDATYIGKNTLELFRDGELALEYTSNIFNDETEGVITFQNNLRIPEPNPDQTADEQIEMLREIIPLLFGGIKTGVDEKLNDPEVVKDLTEQINNSK